MKHTIPHKDRGIVCFRKIVCFFIKQLCAAVELLFFVTENLHYNCVTFAMNSCYEIEAEEAYEKAKKNIFNDKQ